MQQINSDLIVFTDAGTEFDSDFLIEIAGAFADETVGATAGYLLFGEKPGDVNVRSQGFYWSYELKLRTLESHLGCLAVVAGAAFAIRRGLMRPMDPAIGEDCIVPLDVVTQGYRIVHAENARAFETFEQDAGITFRSRTRMTLRNWQGTWSRPGLLNPLKHPRYAFALWSHKLLRWLSPVFLLTGTASSAGLLMLNPGPASLLASAPFTMLFSLGLLGLLNRKLPGTGMAFSFLIANTAFLLGILRAVRGRKVLSYRNV
ncbi:MAG: glycosyltransferase family 2 protein [Planctomycetaceae bacterium]